MPADYSPILLPNSGSQVIRSVVGQKHILQLVSNPSTGYRWDYDYKEPVRGCLEIVGRNLEYDESEKYSDGLKMPGAPGKQQWLIKTNCEGTYRITFIYKRPWEQGPPLYQSTTVINTYKQ
jgi:predicted secreted protein